MAQNNLKLLAEEYEISPTLKREIRNNVQSRLNLVKFFGNIFDLYVSNAGLVMSGMLANSNENHSRFSDEDDDEDELPLSLRR